MTQSKLISTGIILATAAVCAGAGWYVYAEYGQKHSSETATYVRLPVPYLSQAPDGNWANPWGNACEEASTLMVEGYYHKFSEINKEVAKERMGQMFVWENENFGKNFDTTAEETSLLIAANADFETIIKDNPTVDDIKNELRKRQPVLAMLDQYDLYQTPRELSSSFHVLVIIGFDDAKQEFIVNDPAKNIRRYSYDRLMKSLSDYVEEKDEAAGKPVVLFTKNKLL